MSAKIIAFEGGDGAGKGTQTGALVSAARQAGFKADSLAFPDYDNNVAGSICGQLLRGDFGSVASLHHDLRMLAFATDRFEALPRLQAMMASNDVVVIDRYVASNAVYQGAFLSDEAFQAFATKVFTFEHNLLPKADLTVFLKTAPEISQAKAVARAALDENEKSLKLQKAVVGRYGQLVDWDLGGPWQTIDVMDQRQGDYRPITEIHSQIWHLIEPMLRS